MSYHAVFVPDGSPPVCREFSSRDELLTYLGGLPDEYAFCYVFNGDRLAISPGAPRILVEGEEVIPVHRAEPGAEVPFPPGDGRLGQPVEGTDEAYDNLTPSFGDEG
jgi:hypothetical protein